MRGIRSRGDESHGIEISASLRSVTAWTGEAGVVPHAFDQAEFGASPRRSRTFGPDPFLTTAAISPASNLNG